MAAPADAGRIGTNFATAADPWTVNLPGGIQAGDLLVAYGRTGGTPTFNLPAGWYGFVLQNYAGDATDDVLSIIVKTATGSEGSSFSWDLSAAAKGCAVVWRITGAPALGGADMVIEANSAIFANVVNTANPPAINPTGGSKDYLFLAVCGMGGATSITALPAGYGNSVAASSGTGGASATNTSLLGGSRTATTASEDPGIFTHALPALGGTATTIVIHPAPPAGPQTFFGASSLATVLGRQVAATRKTFSSLERPVTFVATVAGVVPAVTHYGAVSVAVSVGAVTAGRRGTTGTVARPFGFAAATAARRQTFGTVARPMVFAAASQARKHAFSAVARPFGFATAVAARKQTFGTVARPVTLLAVTEGLVQPTTPTQYGSVAMAITAAAASSARRRTFGRSQATVTLASDSAGQRSAFGRSTLELVLGVAAAARRGTFGALDRPFTLGIVVYYRPAVTLVCLAVIERQLVAVAASDAPLLEPALELADAATVAVNGTVRPLVELAATDRPLVRIVLSVRSCELAPV